VSFARAALWYAVFRAVNDVASGLLAGHGSPRADPAAVHPGYYLPTVAGGLVGAITLSQCSPARTRPGSSGAGVGPWVIPGLVVLNRLMTAQRLPAALSAPYRGIELAPPALAGVAWSRSAAPRHRSSRTPSRVWC